MVSGSKGCTHHMPGNAPLSDTPSSNRSTKNCTLLFTAGFRDTHRH